MPQIAVVFAGCGVYDGTEVHEAAAALGTKYISFIDVMFLSWYECPILLVLMWLLCCLVSSSLTDIGSCPNT